MVIQKLHTADQLPSRKLDTSYANKYAYKLILYYAIARTYRGFDSYASYKDRGESIWRIGFGSTEIRDKVISGRTKATREEIEEQLKSNQTKKDIYEYLISEIIIRPIDKENPQEEIKELKNKIKTDGFEEAAKELSISQSSLKGGDLGWLSENVISEKYISEISQTKLGNLAEPIVLPEKDILIFKVRDKRKLKRDLEEEKNQLVYLEKTKILQMHASSHYDKIKRSTAIKFIKNE